LKEAAFFVTWFSSAHLASATYAHVRVYSCVIQSSLKLLNIRSWFLLHIYSRELCI